MSESETMLVRLVPFNPRKGFLLRRLMVHRKLYMNNAPENTPGKWYEVPVDIANILAEKTQPNSELRAFDVCTHAEADRIDEKAEETATRPSRRPKVLDFGDRTTRRAPTAAVPKADPPEQPGQPDLSEDGDDEPLPATVARARRRRARPTAAAPE